MTNKYYGEEAFNKSQEIEPPYIPRVWFVSDTHFGHTNIIKYCGRPFKSAEEMDEELIARWNACVHPDDVIFHLGDVGFNYGNLFRIVDRLNGEKQLVRGNHDWNPARMEALGFICVTHRRNEVYSTIMNERRFLMAHRPRDIPTFNPEAYTKWKMPEVRVCGHEHNNAPFFIRWVRDKGDTARAIMTLNISCEHTNFTPVSAERIIEVYDENVHPYVQGLGQRK